MRHVTPQEIAAGKAALHRHYKYLQSIKSDEIHNGKKHLSEDFRELKVNISNEHNADDFAFSAWCASQRRGWQEKRDMERAEYKRREAVKNR